MFLFSIIFAIIWLNLKSKETSFDQLLEWHYQVDRPGMGWGRVLIMLVKLWKVLFSYTKSSKVCFNFYVTYNIGILLLTFGVWSYFLNLHGSCDQNSYVSGPLLRRNLISISKAKRWTDKRKILYDSLKTVWKLAIIRVVCLRLLQ